MSSPAGSSEKFKNKRPDDGDEEKDGKKPTVLESHGYKLGKPVGSGTFSTVRVASSEKHKGYVAIKIVRKYSAPADFLIKFLPREIEVIKKLHHPNLIRFLQAIETTHRVYIIMEYAERGSVLDAIRMEGNIDEARSRKWFEQLVEAIAYCHDRGVVHRDIKCENMLLDRHWNVKLSDFGFAKEHIRGEMTFSETYCGSYAYASPEILLGIPYQPQHADSWSMGVVLYGMVFGRLPFDDSVHKKLVKQVMGRITFPHHPSVSGRCKLFITKMLAPLKTRMQVNEMKSDPWLTQSEDETGKTGGAEMDRAKLIADIMEEEKQMGMTHDRDHLHTLITKKKVDPKQPQRDTNRIRLDSTMEETPVRVVVFGGYQDENGVKADGSKHAKAAKTGERPKSAGEKKKPGQEKEIGPPKRKKQ